MNRLIVPRGLVERRAGAPAGRSNEEQAITRLIKYIPAEIISGYMLLSGVIEAAAKASPLHGPAQWLLVALGIVLTPLYLWRVGSPKGVQWWHLPISTVSFFLWAYALGGPFTGVTWFGYAYESWFAGFLAGAFSWVIALVWTPSEKQELVGQA